VFSAAAKQNNISIMVETRQVSVAHLIAKDTALESLPFGVDDYSMRGQQPCVAEESSVLFVNRNSRSS
jgi:hypothetical protein